MINNIQEVAAFRIIIEREKLAKDEKSVQLMDVVLLCIERQQITCWGIGMIGSF